MSLASSVYSKSLSYLRHGQPLWIPEPVGGREVLIGDVGYILDGGFYRVFNVTRPQRDPLNSKGVPHNFEVLRIDDGDEELHCVEKYIPSGSVLSSLSVREAELTASASAGSGPVEAGFAYRFSCSEEHGAVLLLKDHATSKRVHPSDTRFMEYMGKHWRDWHRFLVKERGLGIPPEEIVFVSGWVKTTEWAVAAFVRGGSAHELMFQADGGSFANAKFSVAVSQGHSGSVQHRTGPDLKEEAGPRQDQCIFLSYFKIKRSAFIITSIVAAAEPKDDESPPPSPSDVDDYGVFCAEDEFVVEAAPAHEPMWEPLDAVLDYILQNSQAEVAIASHASLCHLEWPRDNNLARELGYLRPSVTVDNNNLGALQLEAAAVDPEVQQPATSHISSSRTGIEADGMTLPQPRQIAISYDEDREQDDGQLAWWGRRPGDYSEPLATNDKPDTTWEIDAFSTTGQDAKQRHRLSDVYSSGLSTPSLLSLVSSTPSTLTSLRTTSATSILQGYAPRSILEDDEPYLDVIGEDEDEDEEDAEEEVTSALEIAELGRGIIIHGDDILKTHVELDPGTTHLLIGFSRTPNSVPLLLSHSIPRITQTLLCLDISANSLTTLPPALWTCVHLQELDITSNPLYELPTSIAMLTSLRVLAADSIGLSHLPPSMASLEKLHTLSIQRNRMSMLPSWFCMLPSLETLLVDGNSFQGPWEALVVPLLHDVPGRPSLLDTQYVNLAPITGDSKRRSFIPVDYTRIRHSPPIDSGEIAADSKALSEALTRDLNPLDSVEQRREEKQARQARIRVLRPIMRYLRDMHDLSFDKDEIITTPSLTPARGEHHYYNRMASPTIPSSPGQSHPHPSELPDAFGGHTSRNSIDSLATGRKDDKITRASILREIVKTERLYVKSLQELVNIYIKPAAAPVMAIGSLGQSAIPATERKIVFSGLEAIFSFHKEVFLPALETATAPLAPNIQLTEDGRLLLDSARAVANVFVSHVAFMKMYSTYTNNFDTALQRTKTWVSQTSPLSGRAQLAGVSLYGATWSDDPTPGTVTPALTSTQKKRIKAFLIRCRNNPRHSQLNLEAYLLLPLQRIPRYRHLLEELARSCPPLSETAEDPLIRAVEEVTLLSTNMNQGKQEAKNRRALVQWQSRIRGKFPTPLVQPHRRYIMEGPLHLHRVVRKAFVPILDSDGDSIQVECLSPEMAFRELIGILCNDLLILCREPSESDSPDSKVDLWAVLRMRTVPRPASVVNGNTLRLVDNKAILYIDTPSSSDALRWREAINLHIPQASSGPLDS